MAEYSDEAIQLVLDRLDGAIRIADTPGYPQYVHTDVYELVKSARDLLQDLRNAKVTE